MIFRSSWRSGFSAFHGESENHTVVRVCADPNCDGTVGPSLTDQPDVLALVAVASEDAIAGPSDRRVVHDAFDRTLDFAQVLLGMIVAPSWQERRVTTTALFTRPVSGQQNPRSKTSEFQNDAQRRIHSAQLLEG